MTTSARVLLYDAQGKPLVLQGGANLPVYIAGQAAALNIAGPVPVTDNAGSLTVDAPVGTPVFSRLSDGAAALVGQKVMASSLPVALASDQPNVPTNIAAQYGRAEPPTFFAEFTTGIVPAVDKYMGGIWVGAARVVRVYRIWALMLTETVVTGLNNKYELRRIITSRTAGTAITPVPYDANDTITAGIVVESNPTAVTDSSLFRTGYVPSDESKTAGAVAFTGDALSWLDWFGRDGHLIWNAAPGNPCKPIVLRNTQGLQIKNKTGAVGALHFAFEFTDEAT